MAVHDSLANRVQCASARRSVHIKVLVVDVGWLALAGVWRVGCGLGWQLWPVGRANAGLFGLLVSAWVCAFMPQFAELRRNKRAMVDRDGQGWTMADSSRQ